MEQAQSEFTDNDDWQLHLELDKKGKVMDTLDNLAVQEVFENGIISI